MADVRILVSTDAGGEGLNLQFCHVVINYDIPWNPMRLEQRIGRVDRMRAIYAAAEHAGQHLFRDMEQDRHTVVDGERAKGQYAFAARRKAIERIGLSSVRDHRLAELAKEETAWRAQVDAGQAMLPDLYPLVIVRVEAGGSSD